MCGLTPSYQYRKPSMSMVCPISRFLTGCVNIRGVVAQIRLDGKGVGLTVQGSVEVQIVSVCTGTVIVVQESNVVSVLVLSGSFYGQSFEFYVLILMVDQLVCSQKVGNICDRSDVLVAAFPRSPQYRP